MAAPEFPVQGDLLTEPLLLPCSSFKGDLWLLLCDQGLRLTLMYGVLHGR